MHHRSCCCCCCCCCYVLSLHCVALPGSVLLSKSLCFPSSLSSSP
jgi:hypothetical protein